MSPTAINQLILKNKRSITVKTSISNSELIDILPYLLSALQNSVERKRRICAWV